ncbi:hypothetical protein Tco_1325672 [Tanacetum coccineum]
MIPGPLPAIIEREYVLEKDVQELKEVDHTTTHFASLRFETLLVQVNYKDVIEESVQENVINKVKNLLPNFLPKAVSDFATSTILFEKIDKSRFYLTHDKHQALFDALFNSLCLDDVIARGQAQSSLKHQAVFDALFNSLCLDDVIARGQADPKKILRKRDHDGDDKDPSTGPNQGKKTKRRKTKESESSNKTSTTKKTSKSNAPTKGSKSDKSVHAEELVVVLTEEVIIDALNDDVVNDADQPQNDPAPKHNWFTQPPRPPTLDP